MAKKFTKKNKAPAATTSTEDKVLERQRFLQARALRNRRRRKSHQ